MSSIPTAIGPQIERLETIAEQIENLQSRAVREIAALLAEAHGIFLYRQDEGGFAGWVKARLNFSRSTAYRLLDVHKNLGNLESVPQWDAFPRKLLYQFAAPGAEAARQEIAERAEAGEPVTEETVIAAVTGRRKAPAEPDPAQSDPAEFDAAASAEAPKAAYAAIEAARVAAEVAGSVVSKIAAYAASKIAGGAVEQHTDPVDHTLARVPPAGDADAEEQHPGVSERQHSADGAEHDLEGVDVERNRGAPEPRVTDIDDVGGEHGRPDDQDGVVAPLIELPSVAPAKDEEPQAETLVDGGTPRMYSLPITPSDFRSAANVRAGIRQILRADGMLITAERKPAAPRQPDRLTLLERRVAAQDQCITAQAQRIASLEQIIKGRVS